MSRGRDNPDATARFPALTAESGAHLSPAPNLAAAQAVPAARRGGITGTLAMPVAALQRAWARNGAPLARPATPHPRMDAAYWLCADVLALAAQLGLRAFQPSEVVLRSYVDGLARALRTGAAAHGIPAEQAEEMLYALLALLDELLVRSDWSGRAEWARSPLQLVYFRDTTAGENFFRRASALLSQPERAPVLLIYSYCLALGFRGRYLDTDGAELSRLSAQIAAALDGAVGPSEPLSPHGEPRRNTRLAKRQLPFLRASGLLVLVAIVVFGALRASLAVEVGHVLDPMHSLTGGRH